MSTDLFVKTHFIQRPILILRLRQELPVALSDKRYDHSLRTARFAMGLCLSEGIAPGKGYLAGLSHDLAREWPDDKIFEYALKDGIKIKKFQKKKPVLLHGRAAAQYLRENYSYAEDDVLEAVQFHTLGKPGMGTLGKILFCADYLEPGRKYVNDTFRKSLETKNIDEKVAAIIEHAVARNKRLAEQTRGLYHETRGKKVDP